MTPSPQTILNHLNHAVVVTDDQCRVVFLSPSAEAMFGTSLRKAQNLNLAEMPVGDNERFGDYLEKTLSSGRPFTHREMHIVLPVQGTAVTVDCTVTLIYEQEKHLLIEMSQVDRIMRIAREEQLINQHQATREVVRGLAHEIKNPLGGIRGAAQLLSRELASDEQREFTDIVITEVDRLKSLINRMLGPNHRPKMEENNILDVIEHVIRLLEVESDGKIRFIKDYDPSIPVFEMDRDQMIQALLNIIRNAWEATGEGCEITLRTRAMRRFTIGYTLHRLVLRLDIIDNGPGIPGEMIEQVFYPMVTGRSEGTGLGLPIAQSIISQHGGLVECESSPGRTQFTIYLPLEREIKHGAE
ncbi:MAG: nitrogen regulation protein NR(II) [Pseudomonadota bacterium]